LLDGHAGTSVPWPETHRQLLETAGPQPAELLVNGEPHPTLPME
jgi:hypothetical protein